MEMRQVLAEVGPEFLWAGDRETAWLQTVRKDAQTKKVEDLVSRVVSHSKSPGVLGFPRPGLAPNQQASPLSHKLLQLLDPTVIVSSAELYEHLRGELGLQAAEQCMARQQGVQPLEIFAHPNLAFPTSGQPTHSIEHKGPHLGRIEQVLMGCHNHPSSAIVGSCQEAAQGDIKAQREGQGAMHQQVGRNTICPDV